MNKSYDHYVEDDMKEEDEEEEEKKIQRVRMNIIMPIWNMKWLNILKRRSDDLQHNMDIIRIIDTKLWI